MSNKLTKADMALLTRLNDSGRVSYPTSQIKSVTCWKQGNFTIVRVVVTGGGLLNKTSYELVGVSKRDCKSDEVDVPDRGREIALARALKGEAEEV